MERHNDGTYIKKGPWTAEEDEVLKNFVNKYGPRDWSSIRSKGLLPRTGKSCRLRWVNKLRPNLISGCKFSAEEERVVIELQAQFGNKWAKIATYLHGRTDNDVKNFWSSRRKRLERILRTPPAKQQKNKGKDPVFHELPILEVPACGSTSTPIEEEGSLSFKNQCQPSYPENSEENKMVALPDLVRSNLQICVPSLPMLEPTPIHMVPPFESSSNNPFSQLPEPQQDISLMPECHDLTLDHCDPNFLDMFKQPETLGTEHGLKFMTSMPPLGLTCNTQNAKQGGNANPSSPDCSFDDFPIEMFDFLEPLPSSSEL